MSGLEPDTPPIPRRTERNRLYRLANPEKEREKQRKYQETHRDEINERNRQRYKENPEMHMETARRSRNKNLEAARARERAYAAARAEKRREYGRLYDQQNPDKRRARERRRRAKKREAVGSHTAEEVRQMYRDQRGLCAYCEADLDDNYHVDHMIPLSRGGSDSWDNLALTCQPCNQAKYNSTVEEYLQRVL